MKTRIHLFVLLVAAGCLVLWPSLTAAPQTGTPIASSPDPREIPLPPIQTSMGTLPGVGNLPVRKEMPDVMVMNDGTKVKTRPQWEKRREEMRRILQYYAVGLMPPPPGNVKGKEVKSESVLDGSVKYRLVHLTFGPQERLSLDIGIFTPASGGPFPAILAQQTMPPPGAAALPRQPQGPNQGRGEDVLLIVGSGPAPATPSPRKGGNAPAGGRGFGAPDSRA